MLEKITLDEIKSASERLVGVATRTPLVRLNYPESDSENEWGNGNGLTDNDVSCDSHTDNGKGEKGKTFIIFGEKQEKKNR